MTSYHLQFISIVGVGITGILILMAFFMKFTKGLFFARFPNEFINDSENPKYDLERKAGNLFKEWVFKYITPLFISFLILLGLSYMIS